MDIEWEHLQQCSRISFGWNDDIVDAMIMAQTNQVMHVQVKIRVANKILFCSFVYADNYYVDRRALWNNLAGHTSLMRDKSWVLLGNFYAALNLEDHSYGGYEPNIAMREFKECVHDMKEGFHEVVESGWNFNVEGCAMYHVVKRLKGLKSPFCKLLNTQGNLHNHVDLLCKELNEIQNAIDKEPNNSDLREELAHYLLAFKEASLNEERFLRQKSKIEWLKAGDSNTTYFHKIVKSKCARNRIKMVCDSSNILHEGNAVAGAFVNHYEIFLGIEGSTTPLLNQDLFLHVLDSQKAEFMVRDIMNNEIKNAIFFMGDDKAPDLDGFTSVSTLAKINDYRPISCCNIIFKCISKIIANRIKGNLDDLVSINQSAFILGRRISDNILLTKELMSNYHKRRGPPRGHPSSVDVIMQGLEEFKNVSSFVLKGSLPVKVAYERFLWCQGEMKNGKDKVAWDSVCKPKHEGGLGIRRLDDFNVALIATHIWSILTHKESLWVKWIHSYKLNGRSFWDVPYLGDFDKWHHLCPIRGMLTIRDITRSGFGLSGLVSDLIANGNWRWPLDWLDRVSGLSSIHIPNLIVDCDDLLLWRDLEGNLRPFSVACAWDSLRSRADVVDWFNIVWFPQCIPRHAFHMWLVTKQS
ncbi:sodium/hydrogen exchanger 6 [Tanacetum coccineum]